MDAEPRSVKGRRTRARLLEAGKSVFERDGFLQARITDIAAAAQVSHGSFYHYFDSKESLFREIAEQVEVRLVSMDDIPHYVDSESGPVDRIRAAKPLVSHGLQEGSPHHAGHRGSQPVRRDRPQRPRPA